MPARLRAEIQQTRPFRSPEQEAFLNLLKTADTLSSKMAQVLSTQGVSLTQYNVLRILRGAEQDEKEAKTAQTGQGGLPCGTIAERMITRDPDITRLLDRLEKAGLITRMRGMRDRRVVLARITEKGLKTLASLDAPVDRELKRQLSHLGPQKMTQLIDLLELARGS
jgi:MarR family transcriptional regulator, organic hydroperoxide resistance regulator